MGKFKLTSSSVELRWLPPDSTGSLPLTSYVVEVKEAGRAYWRRAATLSATQTSYALDNLDEGTEYVVRVIAKNQGRERVCH